MLYVCTLVNCMFSMMIATLQTNDGDLNIRIIHREKFLDKKTIDMNHKTIFSHTGRPAGRGGQMV